MTNSLPYRYDATAFRKVFEHHFTYLAGVERNSHRYAERSALHDPGTDRRWSYRELWNDVECLAGGLAALGVGVGDVVVMQLLNGPEFALTMCASCGSTRTAAPRTMTFPHRTVARLAR
jgi:non-ribosomal peptide synthetase component E (peptide arylation enzyme)